MSDHSTAQNSAIAALAPWFHNLHLPDGQQTAPDHFLGDFPRFKWQQLALHLPQDLTNWRVLDIGCNAGFYSFELAQRGAQVLGIDVNPHYLAQANWAVQQFQLQKQVEFRQMQVYDLARLHETFDLVLFMGVFYHLRYPLLGLDIVAQKTNQLLVFQTLTMTDNAAYPHADELGFQNREVMSQMGWPKMAFIEREFEGDPTNWWAPNHTGVEALLRSAGLQVIAHPGHEMYLCTPNPAQPPAVTTWNRPEFIAASEASTQNDSST